MTLTLTLPAPLERRLAEQAKAAGKSAEALAVELLERILPKEQTLREIMAPFAAEVAASGMSEEEFAAWVDQEVADMRREERGADR